MPHKPILIMAGGTGGHVFPALAVAHFLKQRGVPLLWLGTCTGMESQVVPGYGYQLLTINISGLRGKGLRKWLAAPVIILIAIAQALLIMIQHKPAAVLGMGGFVSGPGGIATWMMRIPLCIHEQNAIMGLTNRLLAPLAHTVMEGFPGTFPLKYQAKNTGNPVRVAIFNVEIPEKRIHLDSGLTLKVLVIGGSQGARTLNETVPKAVSLLPKTVRLDIRHQTGRDHFRETEALYKSLHGQVQLSPFIDDMAEAYTWADLVICRAGALTIAELAAAGIASILIPFPHAVDDHQTVNARYITNQGGALLLTESEFTGERLAHLLSEFYNSRPRLLAMARQARELAKPEATRQVAELCLEAAYA
jgi:UDP-N-acetylglucosamine--N-acetylmuramyl-(pentapeptide) pyrophosphoryl-undecaprenol N-acetylglucosamine transferase